MQALAEFIPLVLFLAAYFYRDIFFALVVLMVAMPIGLAIKYLLTRKLDRMYFWSTVLLLVAGSATLYFRNPDFLYWKPTAFYWAVAVAFLASTWLGDRPLVRRFFDLAGDIPTDRLSPRQWHALNLVWIGFFMLMGMLNLYVAYSFTEAFWVKFKVFGLMGITFLFLIAQGIWLMSKLGAGADEADRP